MLLCRLPALVSAALLLAGCAVPGANRPPAVLEPGESSLDLGFVGSADTDLRGSRRVRAAGPFFEKRTAPDGKRFLAVRPFYSYADGPDTNRTVQEVLWPVFSLKNSGQERFWRFLTVYGHDFDRFDPNSRYRFVAFPFVFCGRDAKGEGYFAVFPIGGTIHDFLTRDKIVFALFPLYAYSTINELKTHSVLWPMGSRTRGPGVERFRVFPVYGKSVYKDRWTKSFVMWPFWSTVHYSYPSSQGDGFMLFPLVSHVKLTDQETWMVVPPLIRWSTSEKQSKVHAPWPFVQSGTGQVDKLYLWPLWGHKKAGSTKSWFCLWPFVSLQETEQTDYVQRRFRVLPFIESVSKTDKAGGGAPGEALPVRERYFKLWPLFSRGRAGTNSLTRIADLWPMQPAPPIEKNYAPLWTVYSHERAGAADQHEFLWGLYRQGSDGRRLRHLSLFPLFSLDRGDEDRKRFSCLLGLCRYEQKGLEKEWRLLYCLKVRSGGKDQDAGRSGLR